VAEADLLSEEDQTNRRAAQLGPANPSITLKVYTHLFEQARHADELRTALGYGFRHLLDVNAMSTSTRKQPKPKQPGLALMSQIRG
jgi:hypothetical protein